MDHASQRLTIGDLLIAFGIAGLIFLAAAPTLRWQEFSSGSENLVVAAALELHRPNELPTSVPGVIDSTWLVPTLQGQPRIAKPPLATWIAAYFVDEETLEAIRSPDRAVRDAAYADLTWQMRWPALASACLTLVFTYILAYAASGAGVSPVVAGETPAPQGFAPQARRVAIIAALVHGATYAFLRYSRMATTDVQLALWVTAANAALALSVLRGRHRIGLPLAGVFLGLAFLAKGPVALIQSAVPVLVFVLWRGRSMPRPYGAIAVSVALFVAIAAPWFVFVALRYDVAALWMREVTRVGATELEPDSPLNYLKLLILVFPWTVFLIGGVILACRGEPCVRPQSGTGRTQGSPLLLCLFLLLVPILIMTFSKDRKDRYLLPMMAPAAVLSAHALIDHLRIWREYSRQNPDALAKAGVILHWVLIAAAGIGFPLAGAAGLGGALRTVNGQPWIPWPLAISAAAALGVVLALAIAFHQRYPITLIAATITVMIAVQFLFAWGYGRDARALSEMRALATHVREQYPHAPAFSLRPGRRAPEDLSIYLNKTVRPVENLGAMPKLAKPKLLFVFRRRTDPLPAPPAGAIPLGEVQRGGHAWHAFALPAD